MLGQIIRDRKFWWVIESCLAVLRSRLSLERLLQGGSVTELPWAKLPEAVQKRIEFQNAYLEQIYQFFSGGFFAQCGVVDFDRDELQDPQDELVDIIMWTVEEIIVVAAVRIQSLVRSFLVRKSVYAGRRKIRPTQLPCPRELGRSMLSLPSVLILGDVSPGGLTEEANIAAHVGGAYFFARCEDAFARPDDVVVSNLTCPLVDEEELSEADEQDLQSPAKEVGIFVFFRESSNVAKEVCARFHCVSLANNHMFDLGSFGAASTSAALARAGVARTGLLVDKTPEFASLEGGVAMTSFALCFEKTLDSQMRSVFTKEDMDAYLERLPEKLAGVKEKVVVFGVYSQEGFGFSFVPLSAMRVIFLRKMVDICLMEGKSPVVFVYGPHCCGDVEIYRGMPIIYFTGDFIGPYPVGFGASDLGFTYRVLFESGTRAYVECRPFRIFGHRPVLCRDIADGLAFLTKGVARYMNTSVVAGPAGTGTIYIY